MCFSHLVPKHISLRAGEGDSRGVIQGVFQRVFRRRSVGGYSNEVRVAAGAK